MSSGMDIGLSGLISGFDWRAFIDKMIEVERTPQSRLKSEKTTLQNKNTALSNLKNQLNALKTKIDSLKDPSLFYSRSVSVSNSSLVQATVSPGAPIGSFSFSIIQYASAASLHGNSNVGKPISQTSEVSNVVIGNAPFYPPISAGFFTIDGKKIEISTSDTLQDVFDKISVATNGEVEAYYDPAEDKIVLSKTSGELIIGSSADTSNFLLAAKLFNNGTNSISSASSLGTVKLNATLNSANLATQIQGSSGEFKINGVSISWNTTDRIQDVLDRINNSNAGVIATYDVVADRFILTNKNTGDLNIVAEDVTGNFLSAIGLTNGTLTRGKDLLFTVNGSEVLRSSKNVIDENVTGIKGLTVQLTDTSSAGSTFSITISSDTSKVKTAIDEFISEYNKTQSLINTQTAVTIGSDGKVSTAVLSDQNEIEEIASKLRYFVTKQIGDANAIVRRLEQIGIKTNGNDNTIILSDSTKLESVLNSNIGALQDLFTNPDYGFATSLSKYIDGLVGEEGLIARQQNLISKQTKSIDDQISNMEEQLEATRQRMIESFIKMEQAQAQINQQLTFLLQRFGSTSSKS